MPSHLSMWSRSRSPLRYPGSKARFAKFIAEALRLNGLHDALFVEPFCGGASVSLALLEAGVVNEIALNDADPAIASFWDTVFSREHNAWLADQVLTVPLTLVEWDRQKALVPASTQEAALRCLYLNRTSFNGILRRRAGPIGGRTQAKRTLDARFNREKLSARIRELGLLTDRVIAVDGDHWHSFTSRFLRRRNAVFYLDPPFYHKAESLYQCCFEQAEHVALRNYLCRLSRNWMLSYDDAPEVRALYGDLELRARVIDSTYSAHPSGGGSHVGRELIYTNLARLPAPDDAEGDHEGLTVLKGGGGEQENPSAGPVRRPFSVEALIRAAA